MIVLIFLTKMMVRFYARWLQDLMQDGKVIAEIFKSRHTYKKFHG